MHVYIIHMYIAVYLRYYVSLFVNINIVYMTPQRATWKNSYYMLNVLPSLDKVLLLLLLLYHARECFHFVTYSVLKLYEIDVILLFDQYLLVKQHNDTHII